MVKDKKGFVVIFLTLVLSIIIPFYFKGTFIFIELFFIPLFYKIFSMFWIKQPYVFIFPTIYNIVVYFVALCNNPSIIGLSKWSEYNSADFLWRIVLSFSLYVGTSIVILILDDEANKRGDHGIFRGFILWMFPNAKQQYDDEKQIKEQNADEYFQKLFKLQKENAELRNRLNEAEQNNQEDN